jgi:hypothetical protein
MRERVVRHHGDGEAQDPEDDDRLRRLALYPDVDIGNLNTSVTRIASRTNSQRGAEEGRVTIGQAA